MIHRTIPSCQTKSWQEELSNLITDPQTLFEQLDIDPTQLPGAINGHKLFNIRTTQSYLSRVKPGDPNDPLLLQILPSEQESDVTPGYSADPLEEHDRNVRKGLIHKYHGRVLLVTAPQCAINCRYCFRRHFDYQANTPSREEWRETLDYIRQDNTIKEVILSGGDPLVLADKALAWLLDELAEIAHLTTVRIHSRLPIVLPSRITTRLLDLLTQSRLHVIMVVHCNHRQEIDDEVAEALVSIKQSGMHLFNQSVLLAGINDNAKTLIALSERLFDLGALPYYLHIPDKVQGTSHFDVPLAHIQALHKTLLEALPGYLVPKFVKECPDSLSKISGLE